ncbi:hypothetical protein [Acinetobacter indicus]|uniref:RipA family octameric membrane protein n=1 Tax=Acinetobacter indicus TaxID=756892 RepID=UPI003989B241
MPNFKSQIRFDNLLKNNLIDIETTQDFKNDSNDTEYRLKKIYYIAVKTRNFEITQLVQRNNFFMIFQGVLLAAIIYSSNTVPFVQSILCLAGLYIAYCQTNVAAGAKFWQEYWEREVYNAELKLKDFYSKDPSKLDDKIADFTDLFIKDPSLVFKQVARQIIKHPRTNHKWRKLRKFKYNIFNTNYLILRKPSVSKYPIHVGQSLIIIWAILFLSTLSIFSDGLNWLTDKGVLQGFPNHKESAKQEIYLSKDTDKIDTVIPLNIEIKNLEKISTNQPINIELSINGQKIEAKGVIK